MIDIAVLRENPGLIRSSLDRRGVVVDLDQLIELDSRRRSLQTRSEELRAEQNRLSREIPNLDVEARPLAIAEAKSLGSESKALAVEAESVADVFNEQWAAVPNLVADSAADGLTEEDSEPLKHWGDIPELDFEPLDHLELGGNLGMIDVPRAARVSGTRFAYLIGPAVLMELSLVRWALDVLVERGMTPVVPPVMVREEALFGTGFFPADRDQVYAIERDDLFLVGTSEVPLAAFHMDEILEADDLPLRYAGFSTCFRREAGTHGKDTRGIFRVHQFDKVEMFAFTDPDRSWEEHERMLEIEEGIVKALGIPYRVVNVAAGDLGPSAAKKYDIEAWIPSQKRYREITSCSNTTDYQSRRLKVRYRTGEGNRLVHTLNGTALAVGRTLLAIMENGQRADGSVAVPEVLIPYMGTEVISS